VGDSAQSLDRDGHAADSRLADKLVVAVHLDGLVNVAPVPALGVLLQLRRGHECLRCRPGRNGASCCGFLQAGLPELDASKVAALAACSYRVVLSIPAPAALVVDERCGAGRRAAGRSSGRRAEEATPKRLAKTSCGCLAQTACLGRLAHLQ
jgi:hypothetical protein